jgi:flagellar protein FlaH
MLTAHGYAFPENLLIRIKSICDAHLHLRIEEAGDQMIKSLEVAKIRGARKSTGNIVSFDVDPGFGLRIIPVSKVKA